MEGRDVSPMPVALVSMADTRAESLDMWRKRICNARRGSWASHFELRPNTANGNMGRLGGGKEAHLFLQISRTLCAGGCFGPALDFAGFLVVADAVDVSCNGASDSGGAGGEGDGGRPLVCPPSWLDLVFFFLPGIFRRQRGASRPRDVRNWQLALASRWAAQQTATGGGGVNFWMPRGIADCCFVDWTRSRVSGNQARRPLRIRLGRRVLGVSRPGCRRGRKPQHQSKPIDAPGSAPAPAPDPVRACNSQPKYRSLLSPWNHDETCFAPG